MLDNQAAPQGEGSRVLASRALVEAESDASQAYGDLSHYRVQVQLEAAGWHVDYELSSAVLQGGGPHYVIDAYDGRIVCKRYEQ